MPDDLALDIIQQWERHKAEKAVYDFHCQEVADLCWPNRNDYIVERTPGQKRMRKIFTTFPVWCNRQFAAGQHALGSSPTLQWFSLWTEDDRVNTIPRVKTWLQAAAKGTPNCVYVSGSELIEGSGGTVVKDSTVMRDLLKKAVNDPKAFGEPEVLTRIK